MRVCERERVCEMEIDKWKWSRVCHQELNHLPHCQCVGERESELVCVFV